MPWRVPRTVPPRCGRRSVGGRRRVVDGLYWRHRSGDVRRGAAVAARGACHAARSPRPRPLRARPPDRQRSAVRLVDRRAAGPPVKPRIAAHPVVLAAIAYGVITLVLFRSLLPHLASGFPHDAGDPVLSAWALWSNADHIPFTSGWWEGLAFYPEHGTVAFSDHRVGLGLIASPLLWLGGGPILAHNIAFLL